MKRPPAFLLEALAVLLIVGGLAFLWFAQDWFSTPGCDPNADPVHCADTSGPGPGDGR